MKALANFWKLVSESKLISSLVVVAVVSLCGYVGLSWGKILPPIGTSAKAIFSAVMFARDPENWARG